uniref:Alpha-1,3-glucosyltransferase n=1 Tax=Plectus sambesii TaxID=2011161 RepID=A0A914UQ66_9BILA
MSQNYVRSETKGIDRYMIATSLGALLVGFVFRWAVSIGSYSGEGKPPMFGDYEAQRHWMEITYQLPVKQWYVNSTENDLLYWGLDYPPLTAYHSWLMGFIGHKWNSSWVALGSSRGLETYTHKMFMRATVAIADLLVFLPAVVVYVAFCQKQRGSAASIGLYIATHVLFPGMILMDYGHFQYNCVSLGLFCWAVIAIMAKKDLLGSFLFVCALNYKQMELYHAFPFFFYLLGSCIRSDSLFQGLSKLIMVGATVIGSFTVLWFPFLRDIDVALQVVRRIFPVNRGLFEDKVANVWCALSVQFKWRNYDIDYLLLLSTASVLLAVAPSSLLLLLRPTRSNFKKSLLISSLTFFLFSFQVHEKSILLAAIPALLTLHEDVFACGWFLLVSVISLFPLCVKDGTVIAFFALAVFYYVWLWDVHDFAPVRRSPESKWSLSNLLTIASHASVIGGLGLCAVSTVAAPPQRFPDLFPLLNAIYCCAHFCLFLLYFNYRMLFDRATPIHHTPAKTKRKTQ